MTACQQRPLFLSPEGGDLTVCRFFQDVLKPVLRKDWNCPWVKRDGKGLKQVYILKKLDHFNLFPILKR
jgi:hypothetical protein